RREDLLLPAGFHLEQARALLAEPGDLTVDDIREFVALSSAREEAERKRARRNTILVFAAVATVMLIAAGIVGILQADKAHQLAAQGRALAHAQANILGELSGAKLLQEDIDSALRLATHGTRIDLAMPSDFVKASPAVAALAAAVSQANWRFVLVGH